MISPYQTWDQKEKASAFERKHKREQIKAEIKALRNSIVVTTDNRKLLDKIDFRNKIFKKSKANLKYFTHFFQFSIWHINFKHIMITIY